MGPPLAALARARPSLSSTSEKVLTFVAISWANSLGVTSEHFVGHLVNREVAQVSKTAGVSCPPNHKSQEHRPKPCRQIVGTAFVVDNAQHSEVRLAAPCRQDRLLPKSKG